MNGLLIYICTAVGIILIVNMYKLGATSIAYKKIGKPLKLFGQQSQSLSIQAQIIRAVVGTGLIVLYIYEKKAVFDWFTLAFVVIISYMCATFIYPLLSKGTQLGLYENGAVTQYGVRAYEDCKSYSIAYGRGNVPLIVLSHKFPLIQAGYILISREDITECKKILNKKLPEEKNVVNKPRLKKEK